MPVATPQEDEIRAKFIALSRALQIEAIRQLLVDIPPSPCHCDLARILRSIAPPE
jgi:hypothetical protein